MTATLGGKRLILCQHHGDAASSHEIPHTVHTWPLKACAALSGVYYLLYDLVPLTGSIRSQGFDLLGEAVAGAGLFVCGNAGVEDGPLRAVAVRGRHDYSSSGTSSEASMSRALASLRIVAGYAVPSLSILDIVSFETPAFSPSSRRVSTRFLLSILSFLASTST